MAFSNYQHGFKNGITIRGIPIELTHPGRVFWVGNNATRLDNEATASDGNDGSFLRPWALLSAATAQAAVVAGRGDVVFVRPGVTETLTATNYAFNKADVAYIGLGSGTSRPTLTFDGTADTITISKNNNVFRNFICNSTVASLVTVFTLTTAKFLSIENCLFSESGSGTHLTIVTTNSTTNDADGLSFLNNVIKTTGAGTAGMLAVVGINDQWRVNDNYIDSAQTAAPIRYSAAKTLTNLEVARNMIRTSQTTATGVIVGAVGALASGTGDGFIHDNFIKMLGTTSSVLPVVASQSIRCLVANNVAMKAAGSVGARLIPASTSGALFGAWTVD